MRLATTIWPLEGVQILSFFILCAAAAALLLLLQSLCCLFLQWKLKTSRQEYLWWSNWGRIVYLQTMRVVRKLYGRRGLGCAKGGFAQEKEFAGAASVQGGFVCRGGCNAWVVQRQLWQGFAKQDLCNDSSSCYHSINCKFYETICIRPEGLKQCWLVQRCL